MRILLSLYACDPERGSEERVGWGWALSLAARGHRVDVLTRASGRAVLSPGLASHLSPNLAFHFFDLPAWQATFVREERNWIAHYLLWQRAALDEARALDRRHGFDIVHHITWSSLKGGSYLWRLNKPFVFGPVGGGQMAPAAFKQYFGGRWWTEAIRKRLTQILLSMRFNTGCTLRRADLVLACNRETAQLAEQAGAARVCRFFDVGLEDDFIPAVFPVRNNDAKTTVVWLGRLLPRKAPLIALDSMARVSPAKPIHLLMIGDGPLRAEITRAIDKLGLQSRVTCVGRLDWHQVRSALLGSDAMLFTSLRDSAGIQLLEAMALGLPVITLDHQGARDLVPASAGLKIPVSSPEATAAGIAAAIETLHEDPGRRSSMGRNGWEFAKAFSWSRRAEAMERLYAEVLEARGRPANILQS